MARVAVTAEGYEPAVIRLRAGMQARLVFERRIDSACAAQVKIPALGISVTDLPLGEPTAIDLAAGQPGRYRFSCGMDMIGGTLLSEG